MDIAEANPRQHETAWLFQFLFLVYCSFLVCVLVFVWFENKVPRFVHLDTKDGFFLLVVVYKKNHQKKSL
jgi:hypothetical protein